MKAFLAGLIALLAFPVFAGPISGYPAATTPLTGGETAIGTQSGTTVQITTGSVAALATSPTTVTALPAATTLAGTEPLIGIQSGATVKITAAQISALAGAWTNSISGAVPRTVGAKLDETVSVYDFGAKCDWNGVSGTDDSAAFNNAELALTVNGGMLVIPRGACYIGTTTVAAKPNVIPVGQGRKASYIIYAGTGDAIKSTSPINSSTAVHNGIRDIGIQCTNGSNVGAGYDDVGGTFVELRDYRVLGCGFATIEDQTELSDIDDLDAEAQSLAGVWFVNDAEHTAGASGGFTNRNSVDHSQIDEGSSAFGVADDGGTAHAYEDDNLNGGVNSLRLAGCNQCSVRGGEFESASGSVIVLASTTAFSGASGPGTTSGIIEGAQLTPVSPNAIIASSAAGNIVVIGNQLANTTSAKITGGSTIAGLFLFGNVNQGSSAEVSGTPTTYTNFDSTSAGGGLVALSALKVGAITLAQNVAPVILSGFGTSPSIIFGNTSASFIVQVGTGGTASAGSLTMPSAPNFWACTAQDRTTVSSSVFMTRQFGTNSTSVVSFVNVNDTGTATAWAAGDQLLVQCTAM